MIKKHHTPGFVFARLRQIAFQTTNPSAPWLTSESIEILDQVIRRSDICVEFGSGKSTKWLATRCAKLTSIEHDKNYFEMVTRQLEGFENVDVLFRPLDDRKKAGANYIEVIKALEDGSIDVVLNDGKCRDNIALTSVDKLRSGGLLVIDNAERYLANEFEVPGSQGPIVEMMSENWREFSGVVESWRRIWSSNGVWTTLILFKP